MHKWIKSSSNYRVIETKASKEERPVNDKEQLTDFILNSLYEESLEHPYVQPSKTAQSLFAKALFDAKGKQIK